MDGIINRSTVVVDEVGADEVEVVEDEVAEETEADSTREEEKEAGLPRNFRGI